MVDLTENDICEIARILKSAHWNGKAFEISQNDYLDLRSLLVDQDGNDAGDESMDGDHASALASAGFGTDEDYGYYGDDRENDHCFGDE